LGYKSGYKSISLADPEFLGDKIDRHGL